MNMCWFEMFLYTGWRFHFFLFITQWTKDDAFYINPSWFSTLEFKAFRGAISVCFQARRDKTNKKKKKHKNLLDETNVSALRWLALRLLCYCRTKDRKPDAQMQFGTNLCHRVVTCEKPQTCNTLNSGSLSEGPLTVRGVSVCSCRSGIWTWNELFSFKEWLSGRQKRNTWDCNRASSRNTNNPSMF